ncbi:MAG TPA: hypothetical protein VGL75_07220 [Acidothermaceae bacterium]|jgi:ABC-type uncharacterized transport system ATPase subunit
MDDHPALATAHASLSAVSVTMSLNGNVGLRDFSLSVPAGTVHALLGHGRTGRCTPSHA